MRWMLVAATLGGLNWSEEHAAFALDEGTLCDADDPSNCWAARDGELQLWSNDDLTQAPLAGSKKQLDAYDFETADGMALCN